MSDKKVPDGEDLKKIGNDFFVKKKFKEAIKYYTKAISVNPLNPKFFMNRATAYIKLNEAHPALSDSNTTIRLQPKYLKGYCRKAQSLLLLKKYVEARRVMDLGIKMSGIINEKTEAPLPSYFTDIYKEIMVKIEDEMKQLLANGDLIGNVSSNILKQSVVELGDFYHKKIGSSPVRKDHYFDWYSSISKDVKAKWLMKIVRGNENNESGEGDDINVDKMMKTVEMMIEENGFGGSENNDLVNNEMFKSLLRDKIRNKKIKKDKEKSVGVMQNRKKMLEVFRTMYVNDEKGTNFFEVLSSVKHARELSVNEGIEIKKIFLSDDVDELKSLVDLGKKFKLYEKKMAHEGSLDLCSLLTLLQQYINISFQAFEDDKSKERKSNKAMEEVEEKKLKKEQVKNMKNKEISLLKMLTEKIKTSKNVNDNIVEKILKINKEKKTNEMKELILRLSRDENNFFQVLSNENVFKKFKYLFSFTKEFNFVCSIMANVMNLFKLYEEKELFNETIEKKFVSALELVFDNERNVLFKFHDGFCRLISNTLLVVSTPLIASKVSVFLTGLKNRILNRFDKKKEIEDELFRLASVICYSPIFLNKLIVLEYHREFYQRKIECDCLPASKFKRYIKWFSTILSSLEITSYKEQLKYEKIDRLEELFNVNGKIIPIKFRNVPKKFENVWKIGNIIKTMVENTFISCVDGLGNFYMHRSAVLKGGYYILNIKINVITNKIVEIMFHEFGDVKDNQKKIEDYEKLMYTTSEKKIETLKPVARISDELSAQILSTAERLSHGKIIRDELVGIKFFLSIVTKKETKKFDSIMHVFLHALSDPTLMKNEKKDDVTYASFRSFVNNGFFKRWNLQIQDLNMYGISVPPLSIVAVSKYSFDLDKKKKANKKVHDFVLHVCSHIHHYKVIKKMILSMFSFYSVFFHSIDMNTLSNTFRIAAGNLQNESYSPELITPLRAFLERSCFQSKRDGEEGFSSEAVCSVYEKFGLGKTIGFLLANFERRHSCVFTLKINTLTTLVQKLVKYILRIKEEKKNCPKAWEFNRMTYNFCLKNSSKENLFGVFSLVSQTSSYVHMLIKKYWNKLNENKDSKIEELYRSEIQRHASMVQFGEMKSGKTKVLRDYCNYCGKMAFKKCSRCQSVFYCCIECQKSDWKFRHKSECKKKKKSDKKEVKK